MLGNLRDKAKSWYVKFIIAATAIGLALFYGVDTLRQGAGSSATQMASVNGEPIASLHFRRILENQLNTYRDLYGGTLPPGFEDRIEQRTLHTLIQKELLTQYATQLAVPVADAEIGAVIRNNPALQQDGKFNLDYYKQSYRPQFIRYYGIDYEDATQGDLRIDKVSKWMFEGLAFTPNSTDFIVDPFERRAIHLKRIIIDPKALAPKRDGAEAPSSPPSDDSAKTLATQVLAAFANDTAAEALLKPHGMAIEDLGERKLSEWRTIVNDNSASTLPPTEVLKTLLSLSAAHPLPEQPIQMKDSYYLYKWVASRDIPTEPAAKKALPFAPLFQSVFMQNLENQADIDINAPKERSE